MENSKRINISIMDIRKKWARLAGLCYLVIVISGIFSLMYVPDLLIDWQNPELTFQNINNNLPLFRLGIFLSMVCYLAYVALAMILYQVFSAADKNYATCMVILVLVSIPISFLNLTNKLDIITLLTDPIVTSLYDNDQKMKLVFASLNAYENGITVASLFWGLWLFPFGWLVFHSGFLPKILGVLLMLGCFGYCINIFGNLLIADYQKWGINGFVSIPASLGEIGTCLWLLIMGDKKGIALSKS